LRYSLKCLTFGLAVVSISILSAAVGAAEIQLDKVKLGSTATSVIARYGNPQEIRVGGASMQSQNTVGAPGMPVMPGMPDIPMTGGAGNLPLNVMGGPPGMHTTIPFGGVVPSAPAAPGGGGMPGLPGMPGMPGGMPGMPSAVTPGTTETTQSGPPEVTWVYKFSKGKTLEILINPEGVVVQIAAYGAAWPDVHTSKGTRLGSTYKDILAKYGYPESHEQIGTELRVKYQEKHRVVFTMLGNVCVGITIAL